jgi:molybdate transport system permease protein
LGLLGASGAGKSTIIRYIAGLKTPDCGIIILNGRVLYDSQKKINLPVKERNCGILFQDYALFPHLTVRENIAFGMSNKLSAKKNKQEVERHLIMVELPGYSDRNINELSGGQRQRVALARVKASNPEIILLDEPFSALDTYLRHKQEKLLRKSLQTYRGVTLLITHNLEEAYRVCPNLLIIDRGKAIAYGNKETIFRHSPNMRTAQVTNCKNFSQGIIINNKQVKAIDWNCLLEVAEIPDNNLANKLSKEVTIGIRAHQIMITEENNGVNIFDCWLASYSETQHRVICYLKLHQPPNSTEDYHLQTEVLQDKWLQLQKKSFPWKIQLKPSRIMIF